MSSKGNSKHQEPRFFTAWVSKTRSAHDINPPCQFIIVRNRGDEDHAGDIELELDTPDSVDTFLLLLDEREKWGPSIFKRIMYKRVDAGKKKVRVDFLFF